MTILNDTDFTRQTANPPALRSCIRGLAWEQVGVVRRYGKDQSGTKGYRFNSLGFRGEDVSMDAAKRIFACGCSITFGEGLDLEETWSAQFQKKYAARYGIHASTVNLLNFGESGASIIESAISG